MRVLLTGASGLLGSTIIRSTPNDVNISATYHGNNLVPNTNCSFFNLDIRNEEDVKLFFKKIKPHVVIHTAGVGSPDFCELNKKEAWGINVIGTRNILRATRDVGAHFIFTSTNQVFSGKNPPYNESSKPEPINYYGETKFQNEKDILGEKYEKATILRLMMMYGWNNPKGQKNTATWVIESLTKGIPIKVVDDIYSNFLWVGQASDIIWQIILKGCSSKIIHLGGSEVADRYKFAVKVAEVFGLDKNLILPVKKSFFTNEAPRPKKAILDVSLMQKLLNVRPFSIISGLKEMKNTKKKVSWTKV